MKPKEETCQRITFTILEGDIKSLELIKKRYMKLDIDTNKSEIIRAAIQFLLEAKEGALKNIINNIPKIKPGVKAKNKKESK